MALRNEVIGFFYRLLLCGIVFGRAAQAEESSFVVAEHDPELGAGHSIAYVQRGFDDGTHYDNQRAQSFLAASAGLLTLLEFSGSRPDGTTTPLLIEITTTDAEGLPAEVLGEISVDAADMPISSNRPSIGAAVDVSALGIQLEAGKKYALTFRVEEDDQPYYLKSWSSGTGYADGQHFRLQNDSPWRLVTRSIPFRISACTKLNIAEEPFKVTEVELAVDDVAGGHVLSIEWSGGTKEFGGTYEIEWSTDLTNWQVIGSLPNGSSAWSGAAPGNGSGFVRVRQVLP